MAHETGKPIIDQLKLCYIADSEILNDLKSIDLCRFKDFGDFVFVRTNCHHFQYAYYVYTDKFGARKHIASARFGRYGDDGTSNYFFYRIENSVLYDTELLKISLSIPESLNMVFHNFTALDIAVDVQTDVARMMKRLWSRKDITTIINGKAVRDRRKIIDNVHIVYSVCLDRVKTMTICIKQSKAKNDKTKGITVQAYNKSEEIAHSSHKQYISEYYGSPKRLYRLEVHLNCYFQKEQMSLYLDDGTENPFLAIFISVISTCAAIERDSIKFRLNDARSKKIAEAKASGKTLAAVGFGRPRGSIKTAEKKSIEYAGVLRSLRKGKSIRDTAKICNVSVSTVKRLKKEFDI